MFLQISGRKKCKKEKVVLNRISLHRNLAKKSVMNEKKKCFERVSLS